MAAQPAATADPRIAVIIPCFNDGRLAMEAVRSVREAEPVELVVVDDGSTDPDTATCLEALAAEGVRVIRREQGGMGPAAARMTGVAATAAPFVCPLDADDRLEAGVLGEMADLLERDPESAVAWGDYVLFGDRQGRYRAPDRWLPWTLTYVNPYPICSLLRRDVLEAAGGWTGPPGYEDWDLWLRLAGLGYRGTRVDRVVYRRRLHGDVRMLSHARRNHQRLYEEIQAKNAGVFERREQLRALERPAWWKRWAYPVLFGSRTVVPMGVEAFLQQVMMRLGTGLPGGRSGGDA